MKNHSSKTQNRNPLLMRSAAIIGSFSLFSSGIVLAQTDALVDPVSAPVAPAPAPRVSAPAPAPAPRVSAPAPKRAAPAPRVSAPAPAPRVSAPAPRVSAPAPAPRVSTPAPQVSSPRSAQPQLSAPSVSVPDNSQKIPQSLIDRPRQQQPAPVISDKVKFSNSGPNNFVDNLGSSVVLTERSTGCKTVSSNGRLAQGRCGSAAQGSPSQRTAAGSQRKPAQSAMSPVQRRSQSKLQTRTRTSNRSRVQPVAARGRYTRQSIPTEQIAFYNQTNRQVVVPGGKTSLQFPLSVPADITSSFGFRIHPVLGTRRLHTGTDIAAPMGTPVLAAYQGEVAIADYTGGYGLMVALRHEDGTQESRYAHLSQIFVQAGDRVERGDVIGLVGSTGMSTGPHLHFEWRHLMQSGWTAVDAGVHLEYAMQGFISDMNGVENLQAAEPHIEIGLDFQPDSQVAAKSAKKSPEKQGISRGM